MRIRETLARLICPELGKKADRLEYVISIAAGDRWWLREFPDAHDALQRVVAMATGQAYETIEGFRDKLRQRAIAKTS